MAEVSLVPRLSGGGVREKKRAWYPLFAHALNLSRFLRVMTVYDDECPLTSQRARWHNGMNCNRMTIRNHWRGGGLQGSQLCWPSVCSKCIARVVTLEMAVLDIIIRIAAFKTSLKQSLGRSRRHRGITRAVSITQETRGDGRGGRRESKIASLQFSTQLVTSSLTIPPVVHQATPSPTPATPSAIPLSDNQSCNTCKDIMIP